VGFGASVGRGAGGVANIGPGCTCGVDGFAHTGGQTDNVTAMQMSDLSIFVSRYPVLAEWATHKFERLEFGDSSRIHRMSQR
jgi:hypothetical protein